MPWNEFMQYFTDLSVCQLFETALSPLHKNFFEWKFHGEWKCDGKSGSPNDRAGGCLNFLATFCSNPQVMGKTFLKNL